MNNRANRSASSKLKKMTASKKRSTKSSSVSKLRAPARSASKKQATSIEKVKQFVKTKIQKSNKPSKQTSADGAVQQKEKPSGKNEALVSFFYTNDKFMNQFEDKQIVGDIQQKYSKFMADDATDTELRAAICNVLQDIDFVKQILQSYEMTTLEFFKFIFRVDKGLFRGSFLTKVSRIVANAGYDVKFR